MSNTATVTSGQRYTKEEEMWNSLSHALGILLGIIVGTFFIVRYFPLTDGIGKFSIILYLVGMLFSYITSTTYHACPANTIHKIRLRKFDHAAIYWHIAGSYTPITLIAMRDSGAWGWTLFGIIWLCALVGTGLSFRKMKTINHIETVCYVVMGLLIVIAFKPLLDVVPLKSVLWVVAEGVCYITGSIFYSIYKRKYLHTVFHLFVLAGTACHMTAVYTMLEYCL